MNSTKNMSKLKIVLLISIVLIGLFGPIYVYITHATSMLHDTVIVSIFAMLLCLLLYTCYIISNNNDKLIKTQNIIKESERRLIEAQQMAHMGNWELDLDTDLLWGSEETLKILGIESDSQYFTRSLIQKNTFQKYHRALNEALTGLIERNEKHNEKFKIINPKTGKELFIHSRAKLINDSTGKAVKVVGTIQDITAYKIAEEKILYLSYHDELTGLYNRRFYEEELNRLDTKRNLPMSIIMADVNGLKLVNDSFGHTIGDELLKKVAETIRKGCRSDDIVARLGGDEFIILLPKTDDLEAEIIINRIKGLTIKEKVEHIGVSVSFGWETKRNEDEDIQEVFKNAEDYMYRNKLSESAKIRRETIDLILNTLFKRHKGEKLHSKRVSEICIDIALEMNFDNDELNDIRIAGIMHDIGKIGIDEKILNQAQKLDNEEWKEIKRHSEIGYRILSSVNEFSKIADYILEHHEHWDGNGYPRRLNGEKISLQARIMAIADAYVSITSDRIYGKALGMEEAIKEMRRCSGTQFDPNIVEIFIKKLLKNEV